MKNIVTKCVEIDFSTITEEELLKILNGDDKQAKNDFADYYNSLCEITSEENIIKDNKDLWS